MDGLTAGGSDGIQDAWDVQVRLRRRRRTDADGLVGRLDEGCLRIGRRVDGNGLDPHLLTRP